MSASVTTEKNTPYSIYITVLEHIPSVSLLVSLLDGVWFLQERMNTFFVPNTSREIILVEEKFSSFFVVNVNHFSVFLRWELINASIYLVSAVTSSLLGQENSLSGL